MALAADLTREQHRTKVMAMIGSMIGLMFALSLVGAPLLYRVIGMDGLFALTGALCLAAMAVVKFQVPDPTRSRSIAAPELDARRAASSAELLRLNAGIFILHIVLYAMFVVVPPLLVQAGLALPEHWKLYLPVVLASFVLMMPGVVYADRQNRPKPVLLASVALLVVAEAAFAVLDGGHRSACWADARLFRRVQRAGGPAAFAGVASRARSGTGRRDRRLQHHPDARGVLRRSLGGWVASRYGTTTVFAVCAVLSAAWLALAAGMRPPIQVNQLSTITFSIASGVSLEGLHQALAGVRGVREAEVVAAERIAHLKVVPGQWDEHRVRKLITGEV